MKINLGCGQNKLDGYINVDKYDSFQPEVIHDLELFPWLFDDDSIEEIVMNHSLEHMGASVEIFLGIIKEIYRISKNNCLIKIAVPHPRSNAFEGDPSHVRKVTPQILSLFSLKNNIDWGKKGAANTPFSIYLKVDFEMKKITNYLLPYWQNELQSRKRTNADINFAAETYFNVIDQIHMELVAIKPFRGI